MIAVLQGEVLEATPLSVVIDAAGVGYEVHVPVSTAEKIPPIGKRVKLFIHDVYRQDGHDLYGFARRAERDFFAMIVEKVSGIGPRIALALLSKMSLELLCSFVAAGDASALARTPGIGKKTAERLVIELRDKVKVFEPHLGVQSIAEGGASGAAAVVSPTGSSVDASSGAALTPGAVMDAVSALVALGYKQEAADKAVSRAAAKLGKESEGELSTEALLRAALSAI